MKRQTDSDREAVDMEARETGGEDFVQGLVCATDRWDHFLRAGTRWGWRNLNTILGTLSLSPFDTSQRRCKEMVRGRIRELGEV